ncbi:uncharacterized protein BX664DRAFT_291127 [Halteromyces radiatus]|uniref:uncharacterized protein n=1 Tax=Halteromyces radiatus TaxID=101107 RepID=UPI00221F0997|nr:uncharacterized protein BX664DRAFT_291127 [Halteromyces radiatus]KAI8096316.1 hypothetical protein BX664DRAFT_291127 [Halteromyces radiatus]
MDTRTLIKHCTNGVCHCDWRLTIYGCEEEKGAYMINMVNIGISAFVSIIGIIILFHRLAIKGHHLFDISLSKGCLRPMPVDCMLFFLTIYNILRLLASVLLVTDIEPDNWVARSFVFEISWQFGYGSFALYLIGIAQTLADSHKVISSDWLPSPQTVDLVGLTFFFAPFILNNICSLATGILATRNLYVAEIFIHLLYVLWFVHCVSLSCAVVLSGWRLVRILNRHLAKFQTSRPRAASIQAGIFKIRAVVIIIAVCLFSFASFLLLYGILRDEIMTSTMGNLVLSGIWNWLGPLTTLAVEAAILFNPHTDSEGNMFGLKTSSADKPNPNTSYTGMFDTHFSIFASGQEASFQGTLSRNAFDELKQQHLEYQRQFQQQQAKYHQSDKEDDSGRTDILPTTDDYQLDNRQYGHHPNASTASSPCSSSFAPNNIILTSQTGIPLEDVGYMASKSEVALIQ